MRLSRFECYGFKSFADKIRIDFDAGMTAIVGPNGCGKSNVADAIRWVLGESSMRLLRGERLDDVIFKGTRERKSLSVAEVTLSFEQVRGVLDVDYEDLAITRRVFRDGVSDFLINKVPCRLKDITDVFLDSGVGKDAYSVMEFKMVEQIISPNAVERRTLFEQAAGIMRYKDRIKASRRKLDETEGNLERLGDVIGEVDKNVRSLAYQVRKARRYRRVRAQIVRLELHTARLRWDEIDGRLEELERREKLLTDRIAATQSGLGQADAELEARRLASEERVEALREAEMELAGIRQRVGGLERSAVVNRERQSSLESARERAQRETVELEATIIEATAAQREHGQQRAQFVEPLEAAQQRLSQGEQVINERREQEVALEREVETLRAEVLSRTQARSRLAQEESAFTARIEALEEQRRAEIERREQALAASEQSAARVTELETALEMTQERQAVAAESLATLADREAQLAHRGAEARTAAEGLLGRREAAAARLALLRDLEARLEGYGRAVRELLDEEAGVSGIEGVLATTVRVREGFETAIEAVLAERLQAVLLPDADSARAALAQVLAQGWGRVVLAPRSLAGRNRAGSASGAAAGEGVLGKAADLVEVLDPRAEEVVRGLLEGVVVIDQLDVALVRLAADADPGCTYVTPAGEVVAPGGMLVGGRGNESEESSILARKREIDESTGRVADLDAALEQAREQSRQLEDETAALRLRTEETRQEHGAARDEAHRIEVEAERERNRLRGALEEIERTHALLSEREQSGLALREKVTVLGQQLDAADAHGSEQTETLTDKESTLLELRLARRALDNELASNRLSVARLEAEIRNLEAAAERAGERVEEMQARVARLAAEQAEAGNSIAGLRGEALEIEEQLEKALGEEELCTRTANERRDALTEAREELRLLERSAREARRNYETAREEMHAVEMDAVELRTNRSALRERIRENHRIDLADAAAVDALEHEAEDESAAMAESGSEETAAPEAKAPAAPAPAPDLQEFAELEDPKSRLEELRRTLDRLGQVNVLAIEQHEEETKRLDFLVAQRQDLIDARDSLQETIERINTAAREAFTDTFAKIRENFRDLFVTLFNDGDADVFLEEGVDPLEAKIDIVARPGGKRPQKLTLLSSGEKTMTAIALLFALFRIRPSPFCLLDEIDAPLDDANVLRFNALLARFSGDTQFLVITHNKRTMEAAGSIFGITMEEVGVSKVLSLRLPDRRGIDDEVLASLRGVSGATLGTG